jgi:hypothetical protein
MPVHWYSILIWTTLIVLAIVIGVTLSGYGNCCDLGR